MKEVIASTEQRQCLQSYCGTPALVNDATYAVVNAT
jgi:hypothetical protein